MGTRLSYCPPLSPRQLGVLTYSRSVSLSNYRHLLKAFHGKCAEAVSMFVLMCVCLCACMSMATFLANGRLQKFFFFLKDAKACKNAKCQLQRGRLFLVIFLRLNQSNFL